MSGDTFGAYLNEAITKAGYRGNSDFATAAGLDASLIGRYKRDEVQPTIDALRKMSIPLRTDLLTLLVQAGHLKADEVPDETGALPPRPQTDWTPAEQEWIDSLVELGLDREEQEQVVRMYRQNANRAREDAQLHAQQVAELLAQRRQS
jgi:transcriptional regulator with XRE-family HTH domain